MDDVIAVRVAMDDGSNRFFVLLGRIQATVDRAPVEGLVMSLCGRYQLYGTPVSAHVCEMLREAADSPEAPYFYEALLTVTRERIPFGPKYAKWSKKMRKEMRKGKHVAYCGGPAIESG